MSYLVGTLGGTSGGIFSGIFDGVSNPNGTPRTLGDDPFNMLKESLQQEAGRGVDAFSTAVKQQIDPGAAQREQDRIKAENEAKQREQAAKLASLTNAVTGGMPSIAGIPLPVLLIGGAAAAFFLTRK